MKGDLFASLYNLHYKSVLKYVCFLVQDKDIAHDATYDAFVEGYKKMHSLRDLNSFPYWIAKIASKNALRMVKRNDKIALTNNSCAFENNNRKVNEEIPTKELQWDIEALLIDLDISFREVVFLKYYLDFEDKEIARQLDIPIGTVKSRLYRAKENLKKKIEASR